MKKHLFSLITATACLIAGTVQAQQCCCGDSFYVGALGGVNFINGVKHHGLKAKFDAGYLLGVTAGYEICDNVRVEGEFAYRNNEKSRHVAVDFDKDPQTPSVYAKVKSHVSTYSLMANAYYDFDLCCYPCFTPYVGVGIGYAWNDASVKAKGEGLTLKAMGSDNGFAWQAMAGVDYALCQDVKVGLEYRFFNPAKKLDEQAVVLTVKYAL